MNDYNTVVMCITHVPRKNQYSFKQGATKVPVIPGLQLSPQLILAFDGKKICTGMLCGHYNSQRLPKMAQATVPSHKTTEKCHAKYWLTMTARK